MQASNVVYLTSMWNVLHISRNIGELYAEPHVTENVIIIITSVNRYNLAKLRLGTILFLHLFIVVFEHTKAGGITMCVHHMHLILPFVTGSDPRYRCVLVHIL